MESVRVLIAEDVYALMTVVDGMVYVAPLGSAPFGIAAEGTWRLADVTPAFLRVQEPGAGIMARPIRR